MDDGNAIFFFRLEREPEGPGPKLVRDLASRGPVVDERFVQVNEFGIEWCLLGVLDPLRPVQGTHERDPFLEPVHKFVLLNGPAPVVVDHVHQRVHIFVVGWKLLARPAPLGHSPGQPLEVPTVQVPVVVICGHKNFPHLFIRGFQPLQYGLQEIDEPALHIALGGNRLALCSGLLRAPRKPLRELTFVDLLVAVSVQHC